MVVDVLLTFQDVLVVAEGAAGVVEAFGKLPLFTGYAALGGNAAY